MKPKVIAIGGPTASGKSSLAKEIINNYPAEAISVDSAQIYEGLDIGTGKDKTFPQRMLDICQPGIDFSVAQFTDLALTEIKQIQKNKKIPVLVGGSGYYLDALLHKKKFPEVHNPKLLAKLDTLPIEELIYRLERQDLVSAKRTGKNRRRILRALEIVETTHQPVPGQQVIERFDTLLLIIDPGQDKLIENIKIRLDQRLEEGMIDEVSQLQKRIDNHWLETKAGLEYTHLSQYLDGKISYADCVENILKDSVAYANRQRTWFRRYPQAIWIENSQSAKKLIENFLSFKK